MSACYQVDMPDSNCFTEIKWGVCKEKLNTVNYLDSAHKSGDAWVRIASSVQAWNVVHWEDPQRLEPIRIPAYLIPINAPPAEDCTLEAMSTQACANQCMDFKGLLFAQPSLNYASLSETMLRPGRLPRPVPRPPSRHRPGRG